MVTRALTENQRRRMAVVAVGLEHYLLIPFSLYLLSFAIYIVKVINNSLSLVEGLSTAPLPCILIIAALMSLVTGISMLWVMEFASRPSTRGRVLPTYALVALIMLLVTTWFLFIASLFCFIQWARLTTLFEAGLKSSMEQYIEDGDVRARMDQLQINYACCGDRELRDWFKVAWIPVTSLVAEPAFLRSRLHAASNSDVTELQYMNDDVPFSCCNPSSSRPCIHHHVTVDYLHYGYQHEESVTLHGQGCRQALRDFMAASVYCPLAFILFFIALLQLALLGMCRMALTSMQNAIENEDMLSTADGYLISPGFDCWGLTKGKKDADPEYEEKWALLSDAEPGAGEYDDHLYDEFSDAGDEPIYMNLFTGEPVYENVVPDNLDSEYLVVADLSHPFFGQRLPLSSSDVYFEDFENNASNQALNNTSGSSDPHHDPHLGSPPTTTRKTSRGFESLGIHFP